MNIHEVNVVQCVERNANGVKCYSWGRKSLMWHVYYGLLIVLWIIYFIKQIYMASVC